ncbi:DNA ligase/mRNA capping enzyme [Gigaspora margarita]|uniref:DNA ligase/mRNA capping enzyme n=1 Tax=Gigaspora margarita TaxID=4874 RepID=A0A8H4AQQ3_GIGMA|nr:DNA ligase/mRNA capping enzyme [Gigaspora margarita]
MSETVVFLGTIASRGLQFERAISLGYSVSPTITATTKYVVCGQNVGSEIDDARKLAITILNEREWENLVAQREEDDGLNSNRTSPTTNAERKRERSESSDDELSDNHDVFAKPTTYMTAYNKFWEIRLDGRKTYVRTGNIDDKEEIYVTMKEHKSLADAKQAMINLIARKASQGFQKQNKPPPTTDIKSNKVSVKRQKIDDNSIVSTITNNTTFKKSTTLPPSIINAKPKSILKGNIPKVLLAHSWKEDEVDPTGWWISEKLDGVRAFWCGKRGVFLSRQGKIYAAPAWFTKGLPKDIDLDGELFGGRGKFQSTVSIVKAGVEEWKKITYQVFDVPSYSGVPFEDRMAYIEDLVEKHKPPYVQLVQHKYCKSAKDIFDELKRVETAGGEGLMIRKPKSEYACGRSNTLLKIKTFFDGEALVEGYERGKGKYTGMTGALKCVMACGKKFKVGSGLSDKERKNPPKIGSIIIYRCQELSDSGSPRFPTFVGVAIDKNKPKDPDFGHKLKIK